jgi:hypothetical protein
MAHYYRDQIAQLREALADEHAQAGAADIRSESRRKVQELIRFSMQAPQPNELAGSFELSALVEKGFKQHLNDKF